jgi:predicted TPR repeat methyltransferase
MLAIGYFEQALVLDPEFARAELFLAHSLASAGKFDAADTALANAARLGIDATDVAVARKRLDDLRNGEAQ